MFNKISEFFSGGAAAGPFSGKTPVAMFTDAFKTAIKGEQQENVDNAARYKGFRDKTVKRHLPFLRSLTGWGSYKVTQTKYPSHFTFRECRAADMAHKATAQAKRDRKAQRRIGELKRDLALA